MSVHSPDSFFISFFLYFFIFVKKFWYSVHNCTLSMIALPSYCFVSSPLDSSLHVAIRKHPQRVVAARLISKLPYLFFL